MLVSLLLLPLLLLPGGSGGAATSSHPPAILLLHSIQGDPFEEFVEGFRQSLPAAALRQVPWEGELEGVREMAENTGLVVAAGSRACEAAVRAAPRRPLLCTLLARLEFDRIRQEMADRPPHPSLTALFSDQPIGRQLALVRSLLSPEQPVGVVVGAVHGGFADAIRQQALGMGIPLQLALVGEGETLVRELEPLLSRVELLLAVVDSRVYTPTSAGSILLLSYRHGVPVLGFSEAFTRAGAMLSLYATPEQLGRESGDLAAGMIRHHTVPPPRHSREFAIAINQGVARSLGFVLPEARVLQEKLSQLEDRKPLP